MVAAGALTGRVGARWTYGPRLAGVIALAA